MSNHLVFAIRADASLEIGTGHVMRCLTLADALRKHGAECIFLCREHPGHLIDLIRQRGFDVRSLPLVHSPEISNQSQTEDEPMHIAWLGVDWATDAQQTRAALAGMQADWLIVDHYALDARWERHLRSACRHLMVIDDLADRSHDCDLLLDQNLDRTALDYASHIPATCICLTGPKYALLRPEFLAQRPLSLGRRSALQLKQLLISMGGIDKNNATSNVLEALKNTELPSDCSIIVVMGQHAPHLQAVQTLAKAMPWPTSVLVNVQDMAKLMISSDLAIGAAGSSSWERCCMGLPTITLVLADNQLRVGLALSQAGCALLLQTSFPTLAEMQAAIQHFSDSTILSSTSQVCANLVDGMGIDRIVDAVLEFKHEAGNVRPMTSDDLDLVFQWRNHPKIRHEMLTQHEIVFEEHRVWFNRVSADPRKCVLIYEENGIRKGFVQFTNAQAGEVSDWGFYTAPDATKGTGQKLGNAALDYAFEKLKLHKVCGQAIASNKASIKFHLKLGFTQEGILREQVHGMLDYQDLICFGILEREWKAK